MAIFLTRPIAQLNYLNSSVYSLLHAFLSQLLAEMEMRQFLEDFIHRPYGFVEMHPRSNRLRSSRISVYITVCGMLCVDQATRAIAKQSFSTPSKKTDEESTMKLEEQLYSYQSSVEAMIRCLANISSTLTSDSATSGQ